MELEQIVGYSQYKDILKYCKTVNANIDRSRFVKVREVLTEFFGENFDMPDKMTPEIYHRCMIENQGDGLTVSHLTPAVLGFMVPGIPVTLYYDEIDVTNDHNDKHKIREIYIRFYLRSDGTLSGQFYGLRTAATPKEFRAGFLHSHPGPSRIITNFSAFCTGEGPINDPIRKLSESARPFNSNIFKAFLVGIKAYLGWEESLAGYHNIHRFTEHKSRFNPGDAIVYGPIVFQILQRHTFRHLIKAQMSKDSIEILPTTEFEQLLASICKQAGMPYFLARRDTRGEYSHYIAAQIERVENVPTHTIIRFRGEDKKFRIIKETREYEEQLLVDPALTKLICKTIASKMSKYAALSYTTKKNQTVNYGESDENIMGATTNPPGIVKG